MSQSTNSRRRGLQRLASGVVIATAATVVVATLVLPRTVGGAALTVLTGSMEPTYPVGSLVVVRPVEADEVVTGDVITFANPSGSFTTHRVTKVDLTSAGERSFTTKGDANRTEDNDPVLADAVRGRVWLHVPYLGHIRQALSSPIGFAAMFGLVLLSLVWDRVSPFVRRRVRRPVWLSHGMPDSSAAATSTAVPIEQQEQPDPNPAVQTALSSYTGHFREENGAADPVPVFGASVDLHPTALVEQQLMLARLRAGGPARGEVIDVLNLVRGQVVSFGRFHMVVSITGTPEQLDGVERLLRPYGLVEAARSATVHVGGESVPEIDFQQAVAQGPTCATDLHSVAVSSPIPPSFAFDSASSNGHSFAGDGP